MKKIISVFLALCLFASCDLPTDSVKETTDKQAQQSEERALASVEIPEIKNYQERKMVAKWYKTWDVPSIMTYVYLVSYGNIIGYYVCTGKPVGTQSYLLPEDYVEEHTGNGGGNILRQAQDLDGTFGANNAGIRFFTANGTAVEWAGSGASYIYSNAKLPLNVPKLGD